VDQVAGDLRGEGVVAKLNIDENRQAAMDAGVRGIPALVVMHRGKVVGQIHSRNREQIVAQFRQHTSRL